MGYYVELANITRTLERTLSGVNGVGKLASWRVELPLITTD